MNMSFIISVVFCRMLSIIFGLSAVAMKLCLMLRHWWVITPHSKLSEVIIYPCHNLRCFASMLSLRWMKIMNILRWLKTFLWNLHNATQCSVHSVNTMLSKNIVFSRTRCVRQQLFHNCMACKTSIWSLTTIYQFTHSIYSIPANVVTLIR